MAYVIVQRALTKLNLSIVLRLSGMIERLLMEILGDLVQTAQ